MEPLLIKSNQLFYPDEFSAGYVIIQDGRIQQVSEKGALPPSSFSGDVIDAEDKLVCPGLVDTHVHINEPGRTDWEGFETATQAAAAGGITTVVDMPLNCIPSTTTKENLQTKLESIGKQLSIDCGFWGGVTQDSFHDLSKLEELLTSGVYGVKSFLIDSGVTEFSHINFKQAEIAMSYLKQANLPYLFHAEYTDSAQESGPVTTYQQFEGTRPQDYEVEAIEQLIHLSKKTGCHVHIVHLAAAAALPIIKSAREQGTPITAETCPHYLLFDYDMIDELPNNERPLFKCCPPIRDSRNRALLWEGLRSGTIDFIVSDHSPCTPQLKNLNTGDLDMAWGGIMGLQCGFPMLIGECNNYGISEHALTKLMSAKPAEFIGLSSVGTIQESSQANLFLFDKNMPSTFTEKNILFKNKVSPYSSYLKKFPNKQNYGAVAQTLLRGNTVFQNGKIINRDLGKILVKSC